STTSWRPDMTADERSEHGHGGPPSPGEGPADGPPGAAAGGPPGLGEALVEAFSLPLLVLGAGLRAVAAHEAFSQAFQRPREEVVRRSLDELGGGPWNAPGLRELLERALAQGAPLCDFAVEHDLEGLGRRALLLNARRLGPWPLLLLSI